MTERIKKEIVQIQNSTVKDVFTLVNTDDILNIQALILPKSEPYNTGAFRLVIESPDTYPMKPPVFRFLTPIYHPNVDEDGVICPNMVTVASWKPTNKLVQVVQQIVAMINCPDPNDSLMRSELMDLMKSNPAQFKANAAKHVAANAEKRP